MSTRRFFQNLLILLVATFALEACGGGDTIVNVLQEQHNGGTGTSGTGGGNDCSASVIQKVTLSPSSNLVGPVGTTQGYSVSVNCGSSVGSWTSNNSLVATVSMNGLVIIQGVGATSVCFVTSDYKTPACIGVTGTSVNNGQSVTGVTTSTPNISYSTCSAWQSQTIQYTVNTTGGAPTGVSFILLTSHALSSVNQNGMVTPKSPIVAGTDTIKIVSTFDNTKFVLVTYSVSLCNSSANFIDYTPSGGTVAAGSTVNLTAVCMLASGATCTPYWYSDNTAAFVVVGAPSTIVIAGVSYPAGNTATIKALFKGTANICVQAALQDPTIKRCYQWVSP